MADTKGGAFIGYPRGPKPKTSKPKSYEDTWLDDLIKGFLGESQVGGSVLDPDDKARRNRVNDLGQQAGLLLNIPQLAAPAMALGGAIRLRGAKDLIASHVTSAPLAVASSGYLDAPSIGITARKGSEFSGMTSPQLIFSAGKLDPKDAPYPTVFLNRDGYIGSPSGRPYSGDWDEEFFRRRLAARIEEVKEEYGPGWPDLRAAHSFPGASHGLAIAASPNFKSFAEFEKHPAGAALLRQSPKTRQESRYALEREIRKIVDQRAEKEGNFLTSETIAKEYARKFHSLPREYTPIQMLDLMELASRSGTSMAELKHYGKVPISPEDTAVYLGKDLSADTLNSYSGFRDAGFPIFTAFHLGHQPGRSMGDTIEHLLPRVASDKGGFNLPKDMHLPERKFPNGGDPYSDQAQLWNAFIDPKAGGSNPLAVARLQAPPPKPDLNDVYDILNSLPQNQKAVKLKQLAASAAVTPDEATELMKAYNLTDYFHLDDLPWKTTAGTSNAFIEKMGLTPAEYAAFAAKKPAKATEYATFEPSPGFKPKYDVLMNGADEYLLTLDDWIMKNKISSQDDYDQALSLVYAMYEHEYHKNIPNWHAVVESMLDASGIVSGKVPKPPGGLPRFEKSYDAYHFVDENHPGGFDDLNNKVNALTEGLRPSWQETLNRKPFFKDHDALKKLQAEGGVSDDVFKAYKIWIDFLSKPAK